MTFFEKGDRRALQGRERRREGGKERGKEGGKEGSLV